MAKECRSRMAKRLGNEYPNRDNKERCKPSGAVREHWPTKSWRKEFPFRPIKSESQKSPKSRYKSAKLPCTAKDLSAKYYFWA